jgi:transcription antitermination protein NusB
MMRRRKARELALQGLYALDVSGNSIETTLRDLSARTPDEEVVNFAADIIRKAKTHKETLDEDVAKAAENWKFERIALIDRLILRIALCELLYFDDIPPKVTINEAIDLAKKYSTAESGRFVNGILDALFKKFSTEKRIRKRGRGLVDAKTGE